MLARVCIYMNFTHFYHEFYTTILCIMYEKRIHRIGNMASNLLNHSYPAIMREGLS